MSLAVERSHPTMKSIYRLITFFFTANFLVIFLLHSSVSQNNICIYVILFNYFLKIKQRAQDSECSGTTVFVPPTVPCPNCPTQTTVFVPPTIPCPNCPTQTPDPIISTTPCATSSSASSPG